MSLDALHESCVRHGSCWQDRIPCPAITDALRRHDVYHAALVRIAGAESGAWGTIAHDALNVTTGRDDASPTKERNRR